MSFTIAKPKDDIRLRIDGETVLFLFLLGLIFLIRVTSLNYNSLFVDEAANLLAGHDLLVGKLDRSIVAWFGGSYIFPLIVTLADSLAGVWGARFVSAILSTMTAVLIYPTSLRLFGRQAALWATGIFGLTGASISVGQMAVYDMLCLPFLALTFYLVVESAHSHSRREQKYLLGAALSFVLATLGKYTAVFYLPALGLIAGALYLLQSRWRGIPRLVVYFILPAGLLLGAYVLNYSSELAQVLWTQGYQAANRLEILQIIRDEIGASILLAAIGLGILISSAWRPPQSYSAPVALLIPESPRPRRSLELILSVSMTAILLTAFLALPVYQLATENIRSVWKNTVSSLIFLSPPAGYAVAVLLRRLRTLPLPDHRRARALGAMLTILGVFWYTDHALDRHWGFQHSWPNVSGAVSYIKSHGFEEGSRMLVEGGAGIEYYFGVGMDSRGVWADTWFMNYENLQGVDAMTAAIRDRQLDFVVLHGNDTPELSSQLIETLQETGYTIGYEEIQRLSVGTRHLQVFVKPETGD